MTKMMTELRSIVSYLLGESKNINDFKSKLALYSFSVRNDEHSKNQNAFRVDNSCNDIRAVYRRRGN